LPRPLAFGDGPGAVLITPARLEVLYAPLLVRSQS
jgi:hypothetical protein